MMFAALGLKIAQWLAGAGFTALVDGYKAKLASDNDRERIAAELAAKDLALQQRERELATQLALAESGRWWTALPRALVCYAFAVYVCKCVVWDKVLAWGSTDALNGDLQVWAGWLMALWFGGRSLEKIARIVKR
jgi:hypothetical protein